MLVSFDECVMSLAYCEQIMSRIHELWVMSLSDMTRISNEWVMSQINDGYTQRQVHTTTGQHMAVGDAGIHLFFATHCSIHHPINDRSIHGSRWCRHSFDEWVMSLAYCEQITSLENESCLKSTVCKHKEVMQAFKWCRHFESSDLSSDDNDLLSCL